MTRLIAGVERNLSASSPKTARAQLEALRKRVSNAISAQERKSCERRMDRLSESTAFFRAACRRYIGEQADIAVDGIERCIDSMRRLARARGNKKAERGRKRVLGDFRKKRRKPIYKPINSLERTGDPLRGSPVAQFRRFGGWKEHDNR